MPPVGAVDRWHSEWQRHRLRPADRVRCRCLSPPAARWDAASATRQAGHEPAAGKRVRRRHPKRLLVVIPLDGGDRNGKRLEPAANGREEPRSGVRQRQRARPAAEQRAPAIAFQQSDLVADRCGRHAQLRRGLLETQMPGGGVKRAELDERWQLLHAFSVDEIGSSSAEFFAFAPEAAGGKT